MKRNHIKFMTKSELLLTSMMNTAKYQKFRSLHHVDDFDDIFEKCYTPYEKEKEVLESMIKEALKRTRDDCVLTDRLKLSTNDVTNDEIARFTDNSNEPDEDDDEVANHPNRMIEN